MPLITQILCDSCHAPKRETNHWYTLTITPHRVEVAPLILRADGRPSDDRGKLQQYFCGRACLFDAMSKWMDALTPV